MKSEAIDADQLVALMVAKVTINNDRWKVCNGNVLLRIYQHRQRASESVWWYQGVRRMLYLTAYYDFDCALLIDCID